MRYLTFVLIVCSMVGCTKPEEEAKVDSDFVVNGKTVDVKAYKL